jgi:hypothetical protein
LETSVLLRNVDSAGFGGVRTRPLTVAPSSPRPGGGDGCGSWAVLDLAYKMRMSYLPSTLMGMKTRMAVPIVSLVLLVAGCASPTATPSNVPTQESTTSTAPTPAPTPALTPHSTPTPTSNPVITAGPLSVPGELNFGSDDFGGVAYGQAASVYEGSVSGVHMSACGDIATAPMLFADNPSTPPWGLFLKTNWDAPGVALADATVQAFLLVIQSQTRPTSPIGPVGPLGIRLGTPEATIESMFPVEAANLNYRSTTIFGLTDPEYIVSERMVSIADVDGGPMVIGIHDGVVVTIMWGNPAYVHTQLGQLWCP